MKTSLSALILSLSLLAPAAHAQQGPPEQAPGVAPGPAPAAVQGFVGMWSVKKSWKKGPVPAKGELPLTPEMEARRAKLEAMDKANIVLPGRNARCLPGGIFDQFTFGFRVEANSEYMLVIGGEGPTLRPVWLKRTQHTPDNLLFPTYQGESLGHMDGNTLVIDTTGIDENDEFTYALSSLDPKVHVVERWRLNNPNELQVDGTVESKKDFTAPWHFTMIYGRAPLTNQFNYCDDPSKNASLNTTNPPADRFVPPGADQ
jgi:hypothetical protein